MWRNAASDLYGGYMHCMSTDKGNEVLSCEVEVCDASYKAFQ